MSAHNPVLRFSEDANRDIEDISLYSRRTWGKQQQFVYQRTLSRALRRLQAFPDIGQVRDELFLGCRSLQVEQHIIYYHLSSATELIIVRVLHVRQNAGNIVLLPEL